MKSLVALVIALSGLIGTVVHSDTSKELNLLTRPLAGVQTENSLKNPTPVYSTAEKGRHLIGISNLYGETSVHCGIDLSPVVGTIVRRDFESDQMTVMGFVLRLANDERIFVNLSWDNLNDWNKQQSKIGLISIRELLTLGNYVRVTTVTCGRGSITFADSINKIN